MKFRIILILILSVSIIYSIDFGDEGSAARETVLEIQIENEFADRIQNFLTPLVGNNLVYVDLQLEYPQLISEFYGIKQDENLSLPGLPVSKSAEARDNFGLENRKDLAKITSKSINIIMSEKLKDEKRTEIEEILDQWLKINPSNDVLLIQYRELQNLEGAPNYTLLFVFLLVLTFFAMLMIKSGFRYLGSSMKRLKINEFGNVLHVKGDLANGRSSGSFNGIAGLNVNQKQPLPITVIENPEQAKLRTDFSFLENLSINNFIDLTKDESADDIALILSKVDHSYASKVMAQLGERSNPVMDSFIASEPKSQKKVNLLKDKLLETYSKFEENSDYKFEGADALVGIINNTSAKESNEIFEKIKQSNNTLAVEIRKRIFLLDDILEMADDAIKALMKTIHHDLMVRFLAQNDSKFREKFFKNMTTRAISIIQEDIEFYSEYEDNEKEASANEMLMTIRSVLNFN